MGLFDWLFGKRYLNVLKETNLGEVVYYDVPGSPFVHVFKTEDGRVYQIRSDDFTSRMVDDARLLRSGLIIGGFLYKLGCKDGEYYEIREE